MQTQLEGPPAGGGRTERKFHAEIFLMSLAALLLEVSYTRIISFKLFYYYTYLVIGLALLGIGTGGVLVAVSRRLREAPTETVIRRGLLLGSVSVGIGYLVVALTPINSLAIWEYGTRSSVKNLALLLLINFALFASFVAVGIMLSTLFGRRAQDISRLYFADLLGAAVACAVVVRLLDTIGAPATVALAGLVLAAAALRLCIGRPAAVAIAGVLILAFALPVVRPSLLPDPEPDARKHIRGPSSLFYDWSSIFRVDAFEIAPGSRMLFHDAMFGSAIYEYDGNPASLTRFDTDPRLFPFAVSDAPRDQVLIIGAAGGNEILASLHFDAKHVEAIELNPVTYRLLTKEFADYAGRLAEDPRVDYRNGDGRSYLARSSNKYDLVWYPAPDSYSATNAASSGAFVLSESYLYTKEIIRESFDHLAPNGIVVAQFGEIDYELKPNRTTRYVSTARAALADMGIEDPAQHIVVVTSNTEGRAALATVLVKPTPFAPAEVDGILAAIDVVPNARMRYAPGHPQPPDPATEVATRSPAELEDWYDSYPYDVRPITDDGPFFWHFTPFRDVISNFTESIDPVDTEDAVGERVLLLLLGVAIVFAAVFLLLPFLMIRRTWTALPHKRSSALYFAALGLGFMFFEVTLIQRLTLFLGYPTYSLTVTLASLLVFTGVGSLLSARVSSRGTGLLAPLGVVITGLTAFYVWGLPALTDALLDQGLAIRVITAFVILAPLGCCLGMFMPIGLSAVAMHTDHPGEYVAWGWAVNGFASVVGAVLTTILAMSFGFRLVLQIALLIYLVALLALRSVLRGAATRAPVPEPVAAEPVPA